MKARSRHAPVRSSLTRAVSHGTSLPPASESSPSTPQPAAAWELWLDGLPDGRRIDLSSLSFPQRAPSPLACDVGDLLAGRRAGLLVAPPSRNGDAGPIARFWASPDLCLWQRESRSDASARLAELLGTAVRQGLRTLFVAASSGTVDRLLPRLAADPACPAVHFRAPGERSGSFGLLARFGLEEQRLALRGRLLPRAAQACAERRARLKSESDAWQQMAEAIAEIEDVDARILALNARRDGLEAEVRREVQAFDDSAPASGPFAAEIARVAEQHRAGRLAAEDAVRPRREQQSSLDTLLAAIAQERADLSAQIADARAGRWWTLRYWASRSLLAHDESLARQELSLRTERDRVAAEISDGEARIAALSTARTGEFAVLTEAEIGRRRGEIEHQLSESSARRGELLARWRAIHSRLRDCPGEPSRTAHDAAHALWRDRQPAEIGADAAVASFLSHLPRLAPLIFGTREALGKNAEFAQSARDSFDIVVVEGADQFAPDELLDLLSRAPRALLVGAAVEKSAFAQLWHSLHRDEVPAAYQWSHAAEQLVCTLRPLGAGDAPFVESERLADFPEIELRIYSAPKQPPRLAQVVFPSDYEPARAKQFIYRELQEAAVDRVDRPIRMAADADRFTLAWECPEKPPEILVELEPGLSEAFCVHDAQITTCRLVFQRDAGWDDVKIHDWLRRHLPAFDAPRTAIVG